MDDPFLLVVNPRAGAGDAERKLPALRRSLEEAGARFDVARTDGPGDATRLVREALRGGAKGIAIVGGDGSLNEAVNGFFDDEGAAISNDAWLAPLPCGTGGDFRRALALPQAVESMATRMVWARPRRVDAGWLTYTDEEGQRRPRAFLNIASFGLSGRVVRVVNDSPKWLGGTPSFLIGTIRAMAGFERQRVRIRIDSAEPVERSVLTVAVANGRYFGGGMHIAPEARIDDGLFDVVSLEMTPLQSLALTGDIYRGTHIGRSGVRLERARRVEVEPVDGARVLIDVDGEAPGVLPATFTVKPLAILLRA